MIRKLALAASLSLAILLQAAEPKVVVDAKAKAKAGKYDEAIAQLDAAIKASPKDAALKTGMADVYLSQGDFFMYNEQLPPFRKYPSALRSYRKVLEFDKTNAKAQKNIATIEGIYKSMGRPVPQ